MVAPQCHQGPRLHLSFYSVIFPMSNAPCGLRTAELLPASPPNLRKEGQRQIGTSKSEEGRTETDRQEAKDP